MKMLMFNINSKTWIKDIDFDIDNFIVVYNHNKKQVYY